jgi:signal recognition particle receptor subunit beta
MPVVNPLARELVFKIVYYGPGLGGKTTTLQHIHNTAKPEHRGKMVSLATPVDRTLYFDFLPIRVPNVRGMGVRLQLFTVPGQVHYNATRKLVLTGADGIVLVYDSQSARTDANLETLENLRENLNAHGRTLPEVPHVIQYNKRDLDEISPIDELERQLNRSGVPSFATTALLGEGVYETLEAITRAVLEDFERRVPTSRGNDGARLELPEGGLVEALRRAEGAMAEHGAAIESGRVGQRHHSGTLRLSELPVDDVGEAAARAVSSDDPLSSRPPARLPPMSEPPPAARRAMTPPPPLAPPEPEAVPSFSFDALWPVAERSLVRELEVALSQGKYARAVALSEQLVSRALAGAAALLGSTTDAPRDPVAIVLLLGIDGRRYLEFRALVRDVRAGHEPSLLEALAAYATVLDVRLAKARVA